IQYAVGTGGPIALLNNASTVFGSTTAASTLRTLMSASQTNVLQNEHAKISKRALDTYTQVNTALGSAPAANFPLFPTPNSLADQLKIVARLISVSSQLGARRQVFFVSLGGWDMHDALVANHPTQTGLLANAMRAFYDTTVAMGVADKVTTFT
ncbi:Tat pathway signal protein, partial [Pseudomonas sp. FW305-130]